MELNNDLNYLVDLINSTELASEWDLKVEIRSTNIVIYTTKLMLVIRILFEIVESLTHLLAESGGFKNAAMLHKIKYNLEIFECNDLINIKINEN